MRGKEHEADPLRWETSRAEWETDEARPEPIGGRRDANLRQAWLLGFMERLSVALVGGAFLIGPMWLMVLDPRLHTALVSTTVYVAFFGLLMAYHLDDLKDVMSSTAAYAAVLVVCRPARVRPACFSRVGRVRYHAWPLTRRAGPR